MGTVFQDYDNDGRPDILVTVLPSRAVRAFITTTAEVRSATKALKPGWAL